MSVIIHDNVMHLLAQVLLVLPSVTHPCLNITQVNSFHERLDFVQICFAEDAAEGILGHVEQLAIRKSTDA